MLQKARSRLIIPFLLPAVVIFTLLYTYPIVQTILWSFTGWSGRTLERPFVGLKNFQLLLIDSHLHGALQNTLFYIVVGGILIFSLGLFIAWGLSQRIRFKPYFRFICIAPMVISVAVAGLMWRMILEPNLGILNEFLRAVGLGNLALPWMGKPLTALPAIVVAAVWWQMGMWVLLILAAIERIPPDLQEAALVDGASRLQVFRHVTFPLLWQVLRSLTVVWILLGVQVFGIALVMAPWGGVAGTAEVVATYLYSTAFSDFSWGYATAIGTVLLIFTFALSTFILRVMRREVVEY